MVGVTAGSAPPRVAAPIRTVVAAIPVKLVSDRPDAAPRVKAVLESPGPNSATSALTRPVAPVVPILASALAWKPAVSDAETSAPAANVSVLPPSLICTLPELAWTVPVRVRLTTSFRITPPGAVKPPNVPIRFAPVKNPVVSALPLRTPVTMRPDADTTPDVPVSVTELTALPPVVIDPELFTEMLDAVSDTGAADRAPFTANGAALVSEKPPVVTERSPIAAMLLALVSATEPVTPLELCRVPATRLPAPACVTPFPEADRSTVAPARMWPAFSTIPPLPALRVSTPDPVLAPIEPFTTMVGTPAIATLAPLSPPAMVSAPVLPPACSVKPPPLTANAPTVPILFAVPARLTVPATLLVLSNVAAAMTPEAVCAAPPPAALRSTTPPVTVMTASFRFSPPVPKVRNTALGATICTAAPEPVVPRDRAAAASGVKPLKETPAEIASVPPAETD